MVNTGKPAWSSCGVSILSTNSGSDQAHLGATCSGWPSPDKGAGLGDLWGTPNPAPHQPQLYWESMQWWNSKAWLYRSLTALTPPPSMDLISYSTMYHDLPSHLKYFSWEDQVIVSQCQYNLADEPSPQKKTGMWAIPASNLEKSSGNAIRSSYFC